jgi:peptide/nickel transport system ATP-binding protein
VQLCWQDPSTALDPNLTVARAIDEARVLAGLPRWRADDAGLRALLRRVALDPSLAPRLPGSLSGGQRQRVALARALASEPAILIADEITSAVDRPVAWGLVDLLRDLRRDGLGLLLITHDLSLLPGTVDEVIVLHQGAVVERAPTVELLTSPRHPITRALRAAVPRLPQR